MALLSRTFALSSMEIKNSPALRHLASVFEEGVSNIPTQLVSLLRPVLTAAYVETIWTLADQRNDPEAETYLRALLEQLDRYFGARRPTKYDPRAIAYLKRLALDDQLRPFLGLE